MTMTRYALVALGALAVLAAATPARSLPVDQYLQLRRQSNCDRRLTYPIIQANPSTYLNRTMEIRGRVSGAIRREQSVSFMLTLDDQRAILLDAPPADVRLVREVNNQMLRVLARVTESGAGNLVPLKVLGVAYDAEVTQREREAMASASSGENRRAPSGQVRQSQASLPSRGYRARQMSSGGLSAGLSELARRYLSPEAQAAYITYKQFIGQHNSRLSADELDAITVSILHFSQRHRVDPRLVVAMIIAESDFNPRATSNKGAMGLGQLMPDEARNHGLTNPYDPVQNVRATVNLLRMKLDLYRENSSAEGFPTWNQIVLALAAYNAGGGAVKKYGGVPPYRETQGYIKRILKLYRQLAPEVG